MASASVSCRFAKRSIIRYARDRDEPSRWNCYRVGDSIPYYCKRPGTPRRFYAQRV